MDNEILDSQIVRSYDYLTLCKLTCQVLFCRIRKRFVSPCFLLPSDFFFHLLDAFSVSLVDATTYCRFVLHMIILPRAS